jgi:uroporphyrinogen decarboxylase
MNNLQRIVATITRQQADRVPVIAQVFAHAATLAGVPVGDYVRDGDTLARCQLHAWRRYGYDAVFSVLDVNVEVEAVGAQLQYHTERYPVIARYALERDEELDALALPDPRQAGRMPEMLKALALLRGELADEVLVVGCVQGPLTLATQLLGMEKALYLAIDAPARFAQVLDYATEVVQCFALAQLRAGAHLPMVFDPSASPAVVPPQFFREFELPRLQRLFQALSAAGALANWLHIAGPATPILRYYPEIGVHIANFDYCVTAESVREQLPHLCVDGNLKSLLFVEGSPAEIQCEARQLLRFFRGHGGFILSSGCEIPPESRPENVAALVQAVRDVPE